ncbi:MAG: DUF5063 domain-containing protein [Bacteroidales bacterium]|nr:DUF5063 domain-containing protein [Bacteroidales bacterium]
MTQSPVYSKQTVEFVTVAAEYCAFIEQSDQMDRFSFVDKCIKLLPLLYLKVQLLPNANSDIEGFPQKIVTEEMYEYIRQKIASILGPKDDYLEVFIDDMQYSDSALKSNISEDLSDIYQDVKDFVYQFSQAYEPTMVDALVSLKESFEQYWGQKLVNCLRPLNQIRYSQENEDELEENENIDSVENKFSNRIFNSQKDNFNDNNELDDWNAD